MKLIKALGIAGLVVGIFAFSVFAGENCSVAEKAACKAKTATVSTVSNSKDGGVTASCCTAKTASVKTAQNAKSCSVAEKAACASKTAAKVAEVEEVKAENTPETITKAVAKTAKVESN